MTPAKFALATCFALAGTGLVQAQQAVALDDLDADRLNASQVVIEFEYDGSACESVGNAEVGDLVDGTLAVTFPASISAEVCTQQVVEVEVEQAITVPEGATHVAVTLLADDGTVKSTGTERID